MCLSILKGKFDHFLNKTTQIKLSFDLFLLLEHLTELTHTLVGQPGPPGRSIIGKPGPPGMQGPPGKSYNKYKWKLYLNNFLSYN